MDNKNSGIADILKGIIGKMKEAKREEECKCMACRMTPILNDTSHYRSEEFKKDDRYTLTGDILTKFVGNEIKDWAELFKTTEMIQTNTVERMAKDLKEFEMATITKIVICDKIDSLKDRDNKRAQK